MKLYFHPVSVTSRPVMLFAAENEIPLETQVIDLMTGEHYKPPFAGLNPNRLVPVLEDEDFVLTESSAILKYLAEKIGSPAYPKDLRSRARVNERMDWFNTQFYREYGYHLVYPQIFAHHKRPSDDVQKATLEWGKERAETALSVLESHFLKDSKYVCGDTMTIADYQGSAFVSAGDHIGVKLDKYPNVKAWLDRMRSLKTWAKVNEVHDGFAASLTGKEFITIE
jgi:glutathione S-transferase